MSIKIGTQIGNFRIIELIGRGGMAEVYKARHLDLDSFVALKLVSVERFPPEILSGMLERFRTEAKKMAQLSHPNIVKVTDYGTYKNVPYLVMDYMSGGTLKHYLGKPMPYQQAARLLLPIADALAYVHSEGVIHRDVKPSNILLDNRGRPKLSDFGVAKVLDSEESHGLTATGATIGTRGYMAPEQALGKKIDQRVDIYSLGVIFYELITGRKPYNAETPMEVLIKQSSQPLPPPSIFIKDLPKEVEDFIFIALAKEPSQRFANMDAMVKALSELEKPRKHNEQQTQTKITQVGIKKESVPKEKKPNKHRILGIFGIIVLIFLFYTGFQLLKGGGSGKDQETVQLTAGPLTKATNQELSLPVIMSTSPPERISIPGWKKFEGKDIELWLPESFIGGDFNKDSGFILESINSLGPEYEEIAQYIEQNMESFALIYAFDSNIGSSGILTSALVAKEESNLSAITIEMYLDLTVNQYPEGYEVLEKRVLSGNRYPMGRAIIKNTLTGVEITQVQYAIKKGDYFWVVSYSTSSEEFEQRFSDFEKSANSFYIFE